MLIEIADGSMLDIKVGDRLNITGTKPGSKGVISVTELYPFGVDGILIETNSKKPYDHTDPLVGAYSRNIISKVEE
jgi:hypothetical protein